MTETGFLPSKELINGNNRALAHFSPFGFVLSKPSNTRVGNLFFEAIVPIDRLRRILGQIVAFPTCFFRFRAPLCAGDSSVRFSHYDRGYANFGSTQNRVVLRKFPDDQREFFSKNPFGKKQISSFQWPKPQ